MSILYQKTNKCSTNFHESRQFRSIWKKSIPKNFSYQGLFAKVDTCKKKFRIHLRKLIRD